MKKKVLIIGALTLVATAAITTGVVFALKAKNNKETQAGVSKLNEIALKVKADYDNKSETEKSKIDPEKIKFSQLDFNTYKILEKRVEPVFDDETSVMIVFKIVDIKTNVASDEVRITITGFKNETDSDKPSDKPNKPNPRTKTLEELDNELIKITEVKYLGDIANTTAEKAEKSKFEFVGLSDEYEKSFDVTHSFDMSNQVIIVIKIKEKNGILWSSYKDFTVEGFKKVPLNKRGLDLSIDLITVTSKIDIDTIKVKDLKESNLEFHNLSLDIKPTNIKIAEDPKDSSIAIITFEIFEENGTVVDGKKLISKTKTIEWSGFKKA